MPPKKKAPRNAFYFYMQDWKLEKEEQGQRFSGLKEVAELCAQDWDDLPDRNKMVYKMKEKEAKATRKEDLGAKYDSLGVNLQVKQNQARAIENARLRMYNDIDNSLQGLSFEALKSQHFYLIHTNFYCYWSFEKRYIPCEVAISKFNLKDGVVDTYHVFPAPTPDGKIPLGYLSAVRDNSDKVHKIPEPMEFQDYLEYDWSKITKDVMKFLGASRSTDAPMLFTMDSDDSNTNCFKSAVKNFLDLVDNDDHKFRLYSLSLLFFKLYGFCQSKAEELFNDTEMAFPVEGVAHQQLMRDIYNFSPGISCKFHSSIDHHHNCSLSFVQRWAFLICEFCCKALRINMIPGRHCISTAKIGGPSKAEPVLSRGLRNVSLVDDGVAGAETGTWNLVGRGQHGMRNDKLQNQKPVQTKNDEISVIDRSRQPDPSQTRVLRTGQSQNVVSETMPDHEPSPMRLPSTRGRGELLTAALRQTLPGASFNADDFPAIGEGAGRLAKPLAAGWGRGFMKKE